jgi:hypothetical protein
LWQESLLKRFAERNFVVTRFSGVSQKNFIARLICQQDYIQTPCLYFQSPVKDLLQQLLYRPYTITIQQIMFIDRDRILGSVQMSSLLRIVFRKNKQKLLTYLPAEEQVCVVFSHGQLSEVDVNKGQVRDWYVLNKKSPSSKIMTRI